MGVVRGALCALPIAWLGACVVQVDYGDTSFSCTDGVCPEGFDCVESRCVRPGEVADAGPADARLHDARPNDAAPDVDVDAGVTYGLLGTYFHDPELTVEAFTRVDPIVDFAWDHDSPNPSMDPDSFSIRWVGDVVPRYSEVYTFSTLSDDGVRLWVDDTQLIDDWTTHGEVTRTGDIALAADQAYAIVLEFFDFERAATVRLSWSSATQLDEIIPSDRMRVTPP